MLQCQWSHPELEQLERLRSEIPPLPQSYEFQKFAKNSNFGIFH